MRALKTARPKRKRHRNAALQIWSAMFWHRFLFSGASPPRRQHAQKESGTKMPHSKFGVRCFGIAFSSAGHRPRADNTPNKKAAPKCRTPDLECDVLASLSLRRGIAPAQTAPPKKKAAPKCRTPDLECDVLASLSLRRGIAPAQTAPPKRKRHRNAALQIWSAMFWHRFLFSGASPPRRQHAQKESGTEMPHSKIETPFHHRSHEPRHSAAPSPTHGHADARQSQSQHARRLGNRGHGACLKGERECKVLQSGLLNPDRIVTRP